MTDISKYKSVAIKIDVYNKAKPMAKKICLWVLIYII